MNNRIRHFSDLINREIEDYRFGEKPRELYEPIRYLMTLGGKRMRPLLTLLTYSLYGDKYEEVLRPAVAVEVFHNFTLMHDDIMDKAPLRRGQPSVHKRWNDNVAILSGDVMLMHAYHLLSELDPKKLKYVLAAFNRCAIEVCEGQQVDMNFETNSGVTESAYLEMIRQKTAVLLGFSMELGGILGDADKNSLQMLKDFGVNIGLGFQLMDDLLDVFGDKEKFGKQVGGDIISNKKTFLLIKALELAKKDTRDTLDHWLNLTEFDHSEKIEAVTEIYDQLNIRSLTEEKISQFFEKGLSNLEKIPVKEEQKEDLKSFASMLMRREY